jgi:hypothetical protein
MCHHEKHRSPRHQRLFKGLLLPIAYGGIKSLKEV